MRPTFALCAISLALLAGCKRSDAEVSGAVLMDGAPLKEGEIVFEEADQSVAASAGRIVDGRFKLRVLPGRKIVRIRASRPAAAPDPVMGSAARESMIGEKFNSRSTLRAEIEPGNNDGLIFNVESIPQQ